jgi:hypothetical protein
VCQMSPIVSVVCLESCVSFVDLIMFMDLSIKLVDLIMFVDLSIKFVDLIMFVDQLFCICSFTSILFFYNCSFTSVLLHRFSYICSFTKCCFGCCASIAV